MNIIYRKFKESEIQEIDILFRKSMLSTCPNFLYSFLIIGNYYFRILLAGLILSWFLNLNLETLLIFFFFILVFLLYIGTRIF